jgi:hypothetical protein
MMMPIMNMMMSIQISDQKSVGIAICNVLKNPKGFASSKNWAIQGINGLLHTVVCTTVSLNQLGFQFSN